MWFDSLSCTKRRILAPADASGPGELGALLRREGLYSSHLTLWRRQREEGGWARASTHLSPQPLKLCNRLPFSKFESPVVSEYLTRSASCLDGSGRSLLIGVIALVVAGCGANATSQTPASQPAVSTGPTVSISAAGTNASPSRNTDPNFEGTRIAFVPANFVDPAMDTNPYHPLKPGLQFVRAGTTEVGSRVVPHEIITTMTDVIRIIDGVSTIAMLDESTDSAEVSQIGMDYLALDKDGNVWILGGYTEDYQGGAYTNVDSAYLGTGNGAEVGILAPAKVDADTPSWLIGKAPEEKASVGRPVEVGIRYCVKFGCYDNVRVVQEGNVGAPDNENKYYAPGVGVINNIPLDASLHQDTFQLTNFTALSADGLAQASQTVLDLEAHARIVAPDVFGSAPPSRRLH